MENLKISSRSEKLRSVLKERIVFLDGGMGTIIQREGLSENDFRGEVPEFKNLHRELKGNNDILNITRPDVIEKIHRAYYAAGADIVTTCTFGSTRIAQDEYGLGGMAGAMNLAAVKLLRKVADEFEAKDGKMRFVAGSVGPMNKAASIPPDPENTAARSVAFDELAGSYHEQMKVFFENGADLILLETNFDTLNVKAAIYAYLTLKEELQTDIPIAISFTISDLSGRILSGQTIEAFYASIRHAKPLIVGLNCSLGPEKMRPYIEQISRIAECYAHCYPNAGLPNPLSDFGYDQAPEDTAEYLSAYAKEGLLNVVGGCCGTTPEHISAIVKKCSEFAPRRPKEKSKDLLLSGLEMLRMPAENAPFGIVGERTNVMGSLAFKKLIKEGDFAGALAVARKQIENGANIIDINFDEAMLDSKASMRAFLNMAAAEPEIAKAPLMIDSSDWDTILAGLKCVQGKAIVNSISLKEGEKIFLERANEIRKFGAAALVMAFDENGQAAETADKIRICARSYKLLKDAGFPVEDIIFDANVLTVATGIEAHNAYAVNFIEAVREIKRALPCARTSAGVSNISFAFRGNNPVREAMHSVFLHHARRAGLDFGIVNAGVLQPYGEIPNDLRKLVEDVILNKGPAAVSALLSKAESFKGSGAEIGQKTDDILNLPLAEQMRLAFVKGLDEHIARITASYFSELKDPLKVIEGPLMDAMKHVGSLFGEGKMFLPQVVKSARVMKKAVAYLQPHMPQGGAGRGKIALATVKGDVHDIGKNIVASVLSCNGYEVEDLGVMCPPEKIADAAKKSDLIGLSALITPSLSEIANVLELLEREGLSLPVMVGGATTNPTHTAVKLAPLYRGLVMQVEDASLVANACAALIGADRPQTLKIKAEQEALRKGFLSGIQERGAKMLSFADAKKMAAKCEFKKEFVAVPASFDLWLGGHSVEEIEAYFSWGMFFGAWGMPGAKGKMEGLSPEGKLAKEFYAEALKVLEELKKTARPKAVWKFFRASSNGDDIELFRADNNHISTLSFFRNQIPVNGECASAADFVAPKNAGFLDAVCLFAATAGTEAENFAAQLKSGGKDFEAMIAKVLCNMIAEAYASCLNDRMWKGSAGRMGVRPACGYQMWGDHSEKIKIWNLMGVEEKAQIKLGENFMMSPQSSVCGLWLAHPGAKYINNISIDSGQLAQYSRRKGMALQDARKFASVNIVE